MECLPRKQLEQIQIERLQSTLNRAYKNVPFYQQIFEQNRIIPEKIRSVADLAHIPFTTKENLRDNYPYGMFAVPLRDIVRIHASSGTTGMPIVVGYSANDMRHWAEVVARIMTAGGVSKEDIVQIAFNYGLFTGGFGLHHGAETMGATVIPASSGNSRRQIMIMKDYRTTALVCTPSYALYLAEVMGEMEITKGQLALRVGLFGGEPWSESMREEIERKLGLSATDNYGLSEIMGPGVAGECQEKDGLHIAEDHFIAEIIDPDTGQVLPYGEQGELVLTTLTKEALPMIRYRTHDITRLNPEPCRCGRTHVRMERVRDRTDDMLIVRGVNVYPSQVESVLTEIEGTSPHYQIIVDRKGALDELEILVEVKEGFFFDEMKRLRSFKEKVEEKMESALGISARIKLVEPKTLERTQGKTQRVVDRRKQR
ncbi:MAG: phenylacetate--CoA ligase [Candidatus Latescibacteria bacterium 4484_181]|nr:MAG: phenylacetate--CoA ligase [Candidatus Latescibacteria bacterium 4484_181]